MDKWEEVAAVGGREGSMGSWSTIGGSGAFDCQG